MRGYHENRRNLGIPYFHDNRIVISGVDERRVDISVHGVVLDIERVRQKRRLDFYPAGIDGKFSVVLEIVIPVFEYFRD